MNKWNSGAAIGALGTLLLLSACSPKPIDKIRYPDKKIIALGEATHGNKEFTELKLKVFQQLVEQKQVRHSFNHVGVNVGQ